MNTDTKLFKNWMKTLRDKKSGKAIGQLVDYFQPDNKCCLGHACSAAKLKPEIDEDCSTYSYNGEEVLMPKALCKKLNITKEGAFINNVDVNGKRFSDLAFLNDITSLTPAQIADVIEEQAKAKNFKPYNKK